MGTAIAPTRSRAASFVNAATVSAFLAAEQQPETDMETLIGATEVLLATAVTTACIVALRRRHTN